MTQVGARRDRLGDVARVLDAAVGNHRHAAALAMPRALRDGGDLRHAHAGDDAGGADLSGADADLDRIDATTCWSACRTSLASRTCSSRTTSRSSGTSRTASRRCTSARSSKRARARRSTNARAIRTRKRSFPRSRCRPEARARASASSSKAIRRVPSRRLPVAGSGRAAGRPKRSAAQEEPELIDRGQGHRSPAISPRHFTSSERFDNYAVRSAGRQHVGVAE